MHVGWWRREGGVADAVAVAVETRVKFHAMTFCAICTSKHKCDAERKKTNTTETHTHTLTHTDSGGRDTDTRGDVVTWAQNRTFFCQSALLISASAKALAALLPFFFPSPTLSLSVSFAYLVLPPSLSLSLSVSSSSLIAGAWMALLALLIITARGAFIDG